MAKEIESNQHSASPRSVILCWRRVASKDFGGFLKFLRRFHEGFEDGFRWLRWSPNRFSMTTSLAVARRWIVGSFELSPNLCQCWVRCTYSRNSHAGEFCSRLYSRNAKPMEAAITQAKSRRNGMRLSTVSHGLKPIMKPRSRSQEGTVVSVK